MQYAHVTLMLEGSEVDDNGCAPPDQRPCIMQTLASNNLYFACLTASVVDMAATQTGSLI